MADPKKKPATTEPDRQEMLRKKFDRSTIGLLPKLICRDCSSKSCKQHQKKKCQDCGNYISTAHIHLDYVGHAAVTDRLLQVDPSWSWKPMATTDSGLPVGDSAGNLWIELTILGVTRPGVGDGANMKERIGDAIRNAAMRFGVALDLWSKEELESVADDPSKKNDKPSDDIRSPADVQAERDEEIRMTDLCDQLWDLLKSRYSAKKIRVTIEGLKTSEERQKAIDTLLRTAETPADESAPIEIGTEPSAPVVEPVQGIDLAAESEAQSELSLLGEAKQHIWNELDSIGRTAKVTKQTFIFKVMNKSTIDDLDEAELVMQAIKIEKEKRDAQAASEQGDSVQTQV